MTFSRSLSGRFLGRSYSPIIMNTISRVEQIYHRPSASRPAFEQRADIRRGTRISRTFPCAFLLSMRQSTPGYANSAMRYLLRVRYVEDIPEISSGNCGDAKRMKFRGATNPRKMLPRKYRCGAKSRNRPRAARVPFLNFRGAKNPSRRQETRRSLVTSRTRLLHERDYSRTKRCVCPVRDQRPDRVQKKKKKKQRRQCPR